MQSFFLPFIFFSTILKLLKIESQKIGRFNRSCLSLYDGEFLILAKQGYRCSTVEKYGRGMGG